MATEENLWEVTYLRFSIIIPAYAEEKFIERTLISIRNQTFPDYELLVVLRHSKDRTEEITRKWADRVIIQKGKGLGEARNIGASHAKGDILVYIDADTIIPPDFLERLDNDFRKHSVFSVVPRFSTYDRSVRGKLAQAALDMLIRMVNKVKFLVYGMLITIRKDVLLEIGGFKNIFGEDVEFSLRLCKKYRLNRNRLVRYNPKLLAYTSSRRIQALGFRGGFKLWTTNLLKRWIFNRPFKGYL